MHGTEAHVLSHLPLLGQRCHCSRLLGGMHGVGWGKSIRARCVPDQQLPTPPWDHRDSIRAPTVRPAETRWLEVGWHLGRGERPVNDVIHLCMSMVATLAPTTAEPVSGQTVHLSSTVVAEMGSAQGGSQAEACCYPDGAVVHAQAEGCDRQRLQPGPRLLGCRCKQTGTGSGVRGALQEGPSQGRCLGKISGLLLMLC